MSNRMSKSERTAALNEKPAAPKGTIRNSAPPTVQIDENGNEVIIDTLTDEVIDSVSKDLKLWEENRIKSEAKVRLAQQAQQVFPQHQQNQNNFTRTARSIDEIASVDSIKSTVTPANEIYGENVVLLDVEFKFSTLNNQQIENAWFNGYLEDEPDTDLRIVVNGYMVINQMKTVAAQNGFPIVGRFVKNTQKRNRWEFIAPE